MDGRKDLVAALRLSKWRTNVQSLVVRERIAAANTQGDAITCALRSVRVQLHAQGALLRARRGSCIALTCDCHIDDCVTPLTRDCVWQPSTLDA